VSAPPSDPTPPAPSSPDLASPAGDAGSALPADERKIERRIRLACGSSLVALGLIVWSLLDPRPLPVIAAMTIGQALGTLSLIFFVGSVLLDLRARRIASKLNRR
jgi:hypothetical protein